MKNIYVTENSLNTCETVEQLLTKHSQTNWQVTDVSNLLNDVIHMGMDFDREDIGVAVEITDTEDLANWAITHGLDAYNKANTFLDEKNRVDLHYRGEDYHFVFLIDDILADFILDSIDNINNLESIPTGLQITKYA